MDLLAIERIIADQRSVFSKKSPGTAREVDLVSANAHDRVVVVTGLRRVGKSTLLRQVAQRLDDFHYVDFDDERLLDFSVEDFQGLLELFHKRSDCRTLLMDEIQNIPDWERFVRRIHDSGYKVYLTGSNANLLSAELGTRLTGRHSRIELFPFSFSEYLRFMDIDGSDSLSTEGAARIQAAFDRYLREGGMPEHLKYSDQDFLQRTYEDVLYRDIIVRHGIRSVKQFKNLSHYLFTNITGDLSYNRLAGMLGYKTANSISTNVGYLEDAYLVFELKKYDYSLKKQHINDKKSYVIDNGIRNSVAFQFSEDVGKLLENLVFLELRRRGNDIFFAKNGSECDFIVVQGTQVVLAVQVCLHLSEANRDRELSGLADVLKRHPDATAVLLTHSQRGSLPLPGLETSATMQPMWEWSLENAGPP